MFTGNLAAINYLTYPDQTEYNSLVMSYVFDADYSRRAKMNTKVTLKVPEELYNHAKKIARRDQRKVADVLAEFAWIGSNFISNNPGSTESSTELKAEEETYLNMHPWLKEKYLGEYVAIYNEELVDHDVSLNELSIRIYKRFGNTPIWISKVKENPVEEWTFRSPMFENVNNNDL